MQNFQLHIPTKLYFGRGEEARIGQHLKPIATKVLLHYGGGSIKRSGLYATVTQSLQAAGVPFIELGGVQPNPRLPLVREGIALCREQGVDLILAVGGGSAIDSAKAIAMGVLYPGDVWDLFSKHLPAGKALPVATVLTIPAAGSEMSPSCVVSDDATSRKLGHTEDVIRPVLSVLNPELFFTLPKEQIANGIADMMSHLFERYFTNTPHTDLTDALCEATLRVIMRNAPKVIANPSNYDAWCEIGYAGTLAHNDILGRGRQEDWGSHGIEHELSAIYDIAHGAGLAVIHPAWMTYVYKTNVPMFLQFAQNVMDVNIGVRNPDDAIQEAIWRLRAFFKRIGLPGSLQELGIGSDRLEEMAKKCSGYSPSGEPGRGNFVNLKWQDIQAIYQSVLV